MMADPTDDREGEKLQVLVWFRYPKLNVYHRRVLCPTLTVKTCKSYHLLTLVFEPYVHRLQLCDHHQK